jgi:hypothetical protein
MQAAVNKTNGKNNNDAIKINSGTAWNVYSQIYFPQSFLRPFQILHIFDCLLISQLLRTNVEWIQCHHRLVSSYCCLFLIPLQNPTPGILVAEGGNVLGRQTGIWSTETRVWGIVTKAGWNRGGDSRVTNDPFGAPGSTPSYACLPPAWGSAGGDCLIPRFLWD